MLAIATLVGSSPVATAPESKGQRRSLHCCLLRPTCTSRSRRSAKAMAWGAGGRRDGLSVPAHLCLCHSPSWICTVPSSVPAAFCCLFVKGAQGRLRETRMGSSLAQQHVAPQLLAIPADARRGEINCFLRTQVPSSARNGHNPVSYQEEHCAACDTTCIL